jgi:hypothetical protein
LASDHAEGLLYDGGGLLRADKYHTKKVCQYVISAQDLSEEILCVLQVTRQDRVAHRGPFMISDGSLVSISSQG